METLLKYFDKLPSLHTLMVTATLPPPLVTLIHWWREPPPPTFHHQQYRYTDGDCNSSPSASNADTLTVTATPPTLTPPPKQCRYTDGDSPPPPPQQCRYTRWLPLFPPPSPPSNAYTDGDCHSFHPPTPSNGEELLNETTPPLRPRYVKLAHCISTWMKHPHKPPTPTPRTEDYFCLVFKVVLKARLSGTEQQNPWAKTTPVLRLPVWSDSLHISTWTSCSPKTITLFIFFCFLGGGWELLTIFWWALLSLKKEENKSGGGGGGFCCVTNQHSVVKIHTAVAT